MRYGLFVARDSSGAFGWLLRPGEDLPNVPGFRFELVSTHATEDEALRAVVLLDRLLAIWGGKVPACGWPGSG